MKQMDTQTTINLKEEILEHQNDARHLERLYRSNRATFKREFMQIYPELRSNPLAEFWNERLNVDKAEVDKGRGKELLVVIIAAIFAGIVAKLPAILGLDEESFYLRNIGFIVFPMLAGYFAWKNKMQWIKIAIFSLAILAAAIFINLLPNPQSDTTTLSCIHLLLLLWAILGFAFVGSTRNISEKRLSYLKYNGDLAVMSALLLIAGVVLSGVTVGLFQLLGLNIENFYFNYIGIVALSCLPIIATYLIERNPQLVGRITPVIARIFSPLVLIMLLVYLVAMIYSGKDPYNDRDFLRIFNALLIGVMAVIFFSVSGSNSVSGKSPQIWILFLLSAVTIVVNGIALSAILFRISEWGISPNRAAVLGANLLILANLLMVSIQLFKVMIGKSDPGSIGKPISSFLPIYIIWAAIVTFGFPFLF